MHQEALAKIKEVAKFLNDNLKKTQVGLRLKNSVGVKVGVSANTHTNK